ncbi:MAG: RNA 2',3'-cyclic phosphodiesterase [Acidimicrobiia bacterium]
MGTVERLFVAAPLTDDVRHALAAHLGAALDGRDLPGRPVAPENWHLTLRFLGEAAPVEKDRLVRALDTADLGPSFSVRFGGLGAFPRARKATVLWLGVGGGADELGALAAAVEDAAQAAGFPGEERPFHAHLTLSRIRPHQDVTPLVERVPPFPAVLPVAEVVLFRSHLGRGGARYEGVDRFGLR